jgi:Putative metallopeptidase
MITAGPLARVALAIALLGIPSAGHSQQRDAAAKSQLQIRYEAPADAKLRPYYDELMRRRVLERLQGFLVPLRLPKSLLVRAAQCGVETVPYRSGGPVTLCYEQLERIATIAAKNAKDENERSMVLFGTTVQSLLHQLAIAVFDQLEVPVWGRLHDAADRAAALIMMEFGEKVALTTVLGSGKFFLYSGNTWTGADFARADSPEAQRFYNFLCIAYGGDPITFDFLAPRPGPSAFPRLTEHRAPRCEGEYLQIRHAFNLRIMSFVDPDQLVTVRAAQWLQPDEMPEVPR